MMSFWYFYCYLWTNFTQYSSIFIAKFGQADHNWIIWPCNSFPEISVPPSLPPPQQWYYEYAWYFNFRTSLTLWHTCCDIVAYSGNKNYGREPGTVENSPFLGKQTRLTYGLIHFSTINDAMKITRLIYIADKSSFLS